MHSDAVLEHPGHLTTDWLTVTLGGEAVTSFGHERIGTGQMSECHRITVEYAGGATGPSSVVLKVAAADPTSRQTGLAMGLYEREVSFYTEIAPRLSGPVARCHHAAFDAANGTFSLLLDDAAPAEAGDEIRGATMDQAMLVVTELGRVHGPLLGDAGLAASPWLNRQPPVDQDLLAMLYAGFEDRYSESMSSEQRDVCQRWVAGFQDHRAAEAERNPPMGLVHGDFRLDNLLFGRPGAQRPLTIVDWQTVTWGEAMSDLSYFLGCAVPNELRCARWDDLVQTYHRALGPDCPLSLAEVREGVRRASFMGVTMAIAASMVVERTERGDAMFLTMLERNCRHVVQTNALELLR